MSTDQSRPVSRVSVVEALTQIRALCRDAWSEGGYEGALREYGSEPYTLDYADMDAMNALADRLEEAAS